MSVSEELVQLLESVIPDCRKQLRDSHNNLEKVAIYCEGNYVQATDKKAVLDDTKNYTTQSLASVAYQINTLATNFLRLLDLQMTQISDMESNINHLNQIVMIHKEKVARREIGELTANKSISRPPGVKNPGIIFPEQQERPVKYVRTPIDFTILNHIGCGVKAGNGSSRNSVSSAGGKVQTPPVANAYSSGSVSQRPISNQSAQLQQQQLQQQQMQQQQQQLQYRQQQMYSPDTNIPYPPSLSRSTSINQQQHLQMQQQQHMQHLQQQQQLQHQQMFLSEAFSSPSPHLPPDLYMGSTSPPLPPPPLNFQPASMQQPQQDWIPDNYIEKVVAMYSYQQDKEDELTFDEGAVIYVIKKNDDNWWEGVMDGQTGLFPGNYVEPCI